MALKLKKRDLSKYDLEVLLDTSGSMDAKDTPSGLSRLNDSKKMVSLLITEMSAIDDDGITVACFDTTIHNVNENTTDAKAQAVLAKAAATGSGTYHDIALKARIDAYFERRFGRPAIPGTKGGWLSKGTPDIPAIPANPNCKPVIIVVITDGQPSNSQAAVENVIVEATKRLTKEGLGRDALGISFIQTGKDAGAKDFLERLNNGLTKRGATMDIVNCITIDDAVGLSTTQILEKALDD